MNFINNNLPYFIWHVQNSENFEFKPKMLSGYISTSHKFIRISVINNEVTSRIWKLDSPYLAISDGDQRDYEIPLSSITEVLLAEKVFNKQNSREAPIHDGKIEVYSIKLKLNNGGDSFTVLYHSDFKYSRMVAEYIAKTCNLSIRENIGSDKITRLNTFLDTPYHQLMQTPVIENIANLPNLYLKMFNTNHSEIIWYSPYFFYTNPKRIKPIYFNITILLFGIFSDLYTNDTLSVSFLFSLILILLFPFSTIQKRLKITNSDFTYIESNYFNIYSKSISFDDLEQIHFSTGKRFFDYTDYFFSEVTKLDYSKIRLCCDSEIIELTDESNNFQSIESLINMLIYKHTHKSTQFDSVLNSFMILNQNNCKINSISTFILNSSLLIGILLVVFGLYSFSYLIYKLGIVFVYFSFALLLLFPSAATEEWRFKARFCGLCTFTILLFILTVCF